MTTELKKRCEESPGVAESAVCALGALALALPAAVHSHVEVIYDTLLGLFQKKVKIVLEQIPGCCLIKLKL